MRLGGAIACVMCCIGCDGWSQVRGRVRTPSGDSIPAAKIEVYRGSSCSGATAFRTRGTSRPDGTFSIVFSDSPTADEAVAVYLRKQGFTERCSVVPATCVRYEPKGCVLDEQLIPVKDDTGQ